MKLGVTLEDLEKAQSHKYIRKRWKNGRWEYDYGHGWGVSHQLGLFDSPKKPSQAKEPPKPVTTPIEPEVAHTTSPETGAVVPETALHEAKEAAKGKDPTLDAVAKDKAARQALGVVAYQTGWQHAGPDAYTSPDGRHVSIVDEGDGWFSLRIKDPRNTPQPLDYQYEFPSGGKAVLGYAKVAGQLGVLMGQWSGKQAKQSEDNFETMPEVEATAKLKAMDTTDGGQPTAGETRQVGIMAKMAESPASVVGPHFFPKALGTPEEIAVALEDLVAAGKLERRTVGASKVTGFKGSVAYIRKDAAKLLDDSARAMTAAPATPIKPDDVTAEQMDAAFPLKTYQEDWGTSMRGQGKRVGGMVMGGMSGAPRGVKTYPDWQATFGVDKDGSAEIDQLKQEGKLVWYRQARTAGMDHDDAMRHVYAKEDAQAGTDPSLVDPAIAEDEAAKQIVERSEANALKALHGVARNTAWKSNGKLTFFDGKGGAVRILKRGGKWFVERGPEVDPSTLPKGAMAGTVASLLQHSTGKTGADSFALAAKTAARYMNENRPAGMESGTKPEDQVQAPKEGKAAVTRESLQAEAVKLNREKLLPVVQALLAAAGGSVTLEDTTPEAMRQAIAQAYENGLPAPVINALKSATAHVDGTTSLKPKAEVAIEGGRSSKLWWSGLRTVNKDIQRATDWLKSQKKSPDNFETMPESKGGKQQLVPSELSADDVAELRAVSGGKRTGTTGRLARLGQLGYIAWESSPGYSHTGRAYGHYVLTDAGKAALGTDEPAKVIEGGKPKGYTIPANPDNRQTGYHNGDKIAYTGKSEMLYGKTAYEAVYLEGSKQGKTLTTYIAPGQPTPTIPAEPEVRVSTPQLTPGGEEIPLPPAMTQEAWMAKQKADADAAAKRAEEAVAKEAKAKEKKAKPKMTARRDKKAVEPKPGDIVEVGEHVWGSRKDLAEIAQAVRDGKRELTEDDLEKMDFSDAAYIVSKKNLVNVPTLESLRAQGQTPGAAHMTLTILNMVGAKPPDTKSGRARYAEEVRLVAKSLQNAKTLNDVVNLHKDWTAMHNSDNRVVVKKELEYSPGWGLEAAREMAKKLEAETGIKHNVYRGGSMLSVEAVHPRQFEALGPRFEQFLSTFYMPGYMSFRGGGSKIVRQAQAFAAKAETMGVDGWTFLDAGAKVKEKKRERGRTTRGISIVKQVSDEVKRTGATVDVKDADAGRIEKTFNTPNVQFGEWASQADREFHVQNLEGALYDLSDMLGVQPGQIGMHGKLSFAIGARGKGKARAHYEWDKKIINLTKFSGIGTVAHEWGHALDNMIAESAGITSESAKGTYLCENPKNSKLDPKVSEAAQRVVDALEKAPDPVKAKAAHRAKLDALSEVASEKSKAYRAASQAVQTLKMKATSQENLDKKIAYQESSIARYTDELAKINAEITEKESKGKRVRQQLYQDKVNREYWLKGAMKKIEALKSGGTMDEAQKAAELEKLLDAENLARLEVNAAEREYSTAKKEDPYASNYKRSGMILGEEEWGSTKELFARAFETWVEDSLHKAGRQSTYLVEGTRPLYHTGIPLPDGSEVEPYPQGEERLAIVKAMGELIEVLHGTGTLKKAFEYLRGLAEPSRFVIPLRG